MTRFNGANPPAGTLLVSEDVRTNFQALERANELRPTPGVDQDAAQPLTVFVESGRYAVSSSTSLVFAQSHSPVFTVPTTNDRTDLLYLNSMGNLTIVQGTESLFPTAPAYPSDIIPIAEVTISPSTVAIEQDDIVDVRPLYIAGTVGVGISPMSEVQIATAGQTIFNLTSFSFSVGQDEVLVFAGGVKKVAPDDYVENSANQIEFVSGRPAGERIEFYRVGSASTSLLSGLDDVSVDLAEAVQDVDALRAAPADRTNPLATIADTTAAAGMFGAEHNTSTGEHGPRVNIVQPTNDIALSITKSNTGASSAIDITTIGSDVAINVIQQGNAGSLELLQTGNGNAIAATQNGDGNAIVVTQAGDGQAVDINYNATGALVQSTPALSISRLITGSLEPMINLHDNTSATGGNISFSADELIIADESTNTSKFVFNTDTGRLLIENGGNNNHLQVDKTSTGAGYAIQASNSGSQATARISQQGTGAVLSLSNSGSGNDVELDTAPGGLLDPLWGGPASNADAYHTHTFSQSLSDLTDVTVNEANAFNDTGALRAAAISAANPLASLADIPAANTTKITTGTYAGNNSSSRTISIGFTPAWVMLYNVSNSGLSGVYVANGYTARFFTQAGSPSVGIVSGGFAINGSSFLANINQTGSTYVYIAFGN